MEMLQGGMQAYVRYARSSTHHRRHREASTLRKNSDRHPEEPQALFYVAPHEPQNALIRNGVDYEDKGYALLFSKPSWIQGAEMGINSQGLALGNEAVFSRFKADPNGILGMDILKAALCSCTTAKEAVDFITSFVEKYPQGGNGAYKGTLVYSNSFLAADPYEAYVIETAGNRWAWRKAMVADAISNTYCIEDDYKRLDAQTRKEISPVNERAACSDEADPGRKGERGSWKQHVEDTKYLNFTKAEQRRSSALSGLMRLLEVQRAKPDQALEGFLRCYVLMREIQNQAFLQGE